MINISKGIAAAAVAVVMLGASGPVMASTCEAQRNALARLYDSDDAQVLLRALDTLPSSTLYGLHPFTPAKASSSIVKAIVKAFVDYPDAESYQKRIERFRAMQLEAGRSEGDKKTLEAWIYNEKNYLLNDTSVSILVPSWADSAEIPRTCKDNIPTTIEHIPLPVRLEKPTVQVSIQAPFTSDAQTAGVQKQSLTDKLSDQVGVKGSATQRLPQTQPLTTKETVKQHNYTSTADGNGNWSVQIKNETKEAIKEQTEEAVEDAVRTITEQVTSEVTNDLGPCNPDFDLCD